MANCCDMKEGDVFYCEACGLELKVTRPCSCNTGSDDACFTPLKCCGKEMKKKE